MSKEKAYQYCMSIVLSLISLVGLAQLAPLDPQVYPEKLHKDIDALAELIDQVHPDPYRYHTKAEFLQVLQQVKDSVRVPLDMQQFMIELLPVFHAVGDAHCIPSLPYMHGYHQLNSMPLLPLKVKVLEEGVFVEEELKGFRSLPSGSRVLSINGNDMDAVIDALCEVIVADGQNTSYKLRRIERELHLLYAIHVERADRFTIRFITPEGVENETVIFAMTGEEIQRSRRPEGPVLQPWSARPELENGAMWVTMQTMELDHLVRSGQRPEKFLAAMLNELRNEKVRTLVLDLRGAGGFDLGLAEQVFAAIAKEPYRLLKETTVRSITPPGHYGLSVPQPEYYASVAGLSHPQMEGAAPMQVVDQQPLIEPDPKAFQGKVYVVCDGYTRDAAAALVMLAKRSGRARIFGEETGTNASSFSGSRELLITLPNSGLLVHLPLERHVPEGVAQGPMDKGEVPDHPVPQEPRYLSSGQDPVRVNLLRLIQALR